jgi:hypothetical protein
MDCQRFKSAWQPKPKPHHSLRAELVGTDTDSKPAIRWLIALRWWF